MIRPTVERTIVVRDSDENDESSFTIYVRSADDVADEIADGPAARHVMMPDSVWLTLDDTEQLGRELIALAQVLREEREVPAAVGVKCNACRLNDTVVDGVCTRCGARDDVEPPVVKKAAPRKRAAKKVAP